MKLYNYSSKDTSVTSEAIFNITYHVKRSHTIL